MTERFFPDERARKRLYVGPLGPFVDGFAARLTGRGYARASGHAQLRIIGDLSVWLQRRRLASGDVNHERIAQFLRHRRRQGRRYYRGADATLRALLEHLREAGAVPTAATESEPDELSRIESAFKSYLEQERGLTQSTVVHYLPEIHRFLHRRFRRGRIQLGELRAADLNRHVARRARVLSPTSAKGVVTALRSFCQFLRLRGDVTVDLATSVLTVPRWRLATLPKSIEPSDVKLILKQCDQRTALGQRNYTVVLLLARLGLRAGEVVAMTLDDIDWEAGEFLVRGKGPRQERLPLPHDVGEALATYVRNGRPACSSRRVFIRARAPLRGFASPAAISTIVMRAIARAGVDTPSRGAHLFRYTLASDVLRRGGSLAEVGELLRHRHPDTTALYAKVDIEALRTVAPPWPGARA